MSNTQLAWRVGIHIAFVTSGVLFAFTDRIAEGKGGRTEGPDAETRKQNGTKEETPLSLTFSGVCI